MVPPQHAYTVARLVADPNAIAATDTTESTELVEALAARELTVLFCVNHPLTYTHHAICSADVIY